MCPHPLKMPLCRQDRTDRRRWMECFFENSKEKALGAIGSVTRPVRHHALTACPTKTDILHLQHLWTNLHNCVNQGDEVIFISLLLPESMSVQSIQFQFFCSYEIYTLIKSSIGLQARAFPKKHIKMAVYS